MSDKRYPTRMHEVLEVEPEERFTHSDYGDRKFWLSESGLLYRICDDGTSIPTTQGTLVRFINHTERITRRPRLTEEQVAELKALLVFNKRWLTKESDPLEVVIAFSEKPIREDEGWWSDEIESNFIMTLPNGAAVNGLISWSDPEPLDIVQTLRDAGVEVEE